MYGSYPEKSEVFMFSLWTGVPALLLIETVKHIAYVDNTGRYERGVDLITSEIFLLFLSSIIVYF